MIIIVCMVVCVYKVASGNSSVRFAPPSPSLFFSLSLSFSFLSFFLYTVLSFFPYDKINTSRDEY